MVTTAILERVFYIKYGDNIGSCFTVEVGTSQYLVTARHVLENEEDELLGARERDFEFQLLIGESFQTIRGSLLCHETQLADVAIIRLSEDISNRTEILYDTNQIIFGADAFFLGFPYGFVAPDNGNINNGNAIPLIKKATVSVVRRELEIARIYLDGHNNKGFSGGPVICPQRQGNRYLMKIIGVNTGYMPHEGEIEIELFDDDGEPYVDRFEYLENSGIFMATHINETFEMINNFAQ